MQIIELSTDLSKWTSDKIQYTVSVTLHFLKTVLDLLEAPSILIALH